MITLNSTIEIAVPPKQVFGAINNYAQRLDWDTLLRKAEVLDENGKILPINTTLVTGMSVVSHARWLSGGVVMVTRYTRCEFPLAEIEMIKGPWFFKSFNATARIEEVAGGARWTGDYKFSCRPGILSWMIQPIVSWVFLRETKMRAKGMKIWLEKQGEKN
jgi:hypothetical protein